jgi:hypothetical protein
MIYVLAGAQGTNKLSVAEKLRAFLNEGECVDGCFSTVLDPAIQTDYVVGFLADYRDELHLAVTRARKPSRDLNLIFTHSLLDNLAYAGVRLTGLFDQDPANTHEIARWVSSSTRRFR